jgi:hypothetical protein
MKKLSLLTINKLAGGTVQERRFFDVLCKPTYRLIEAEHGCLGIYREGGGYIVRPDSLFFPDEVEAIYARL